MLVRAREYVVAYEQGLRTIIGEEEYLQEAEWRIERQNGLAKTWQTERTRRQLSSDFLMVPIDGRWYGVRQVHEMDGLPVEYDGDLNAFRSVVRSPAELLTTWPDNVQYNIGSFQRTPASDSLRVHRTDPASVEDAHQARTVAIRV